MKRIVLSMMMGVAMLIASAPKAEAAVILVFGQTGGTNTITGTANVGGTQTTILGINVAVSITAIENGVAPINAIFNLDVTSTAAANAGVLVTQSFAGTFCITSLVNCGGTNYLSGVIGSSVVGGLDGGTSLVQGAAQPPGSLTFTSNSGIISLAVPVAMSLSFTNVTPIVGITGTTLNSFTSSVSGNFSANQVPEPGSMMLLGSGLLGLAAVARRRVRKS